MAEQEKGKKPPRKLHTAEETDENIPHPYYELYRHCILRGANTGSLLALLFAPPILYARGTREPRELLNRTARASIYGVAIGAVGSVIMAAMMTRGNEEVQIYDRSYRLRHNKGQSHLDLVTYPTVGAGAVTGALLTSSRAAGAMMGGSVGFGLSVLIHMLTKGKE